MLGTALAGLVQIAKLGTGDPTTGNGWEMNAIAAAAIGGTSMAGGRGNPWGTEMCIRDRGSAKRISDSGIGNAEQKAPFLHGGGGDYTHQ